MTFDIQQDSEGQSDIMFWLVQSLFSLFVNSVKPIYDIIFLLARNFVELKSLIVWQWQIFLVTTEKNKAY